MGRFTCLLGLCALGLSGLASAGATADPATAGAIPLSAPTATAQPAARVYIDPETRKLGGPPYRAEPPGHSIALQRQLNRSDQGLQMRRLPNGTALVNLQGRFRNTSVATQSANGGVHISCHHAADDASHALLHSADATP